MEIFFGGTGSGYASAKRKPSCIIISNDETSFVLDCGDGAVGSLFSRDMDKVDALAISHMHPDHSGGLPFFVQTLHLRRRSRPFRLFVPENIDFIAKSLIHSYLFPKSLSFALEILPIEANSPFISGGLEVTAFANNHMAIHSEDLLHHPELSGASFSFAVVEGGERIVYSSDIFDVEDLRGPLADGADLLICEAAHIDLTALRGFLSEYKIGRVVLTHIPDNALIEGDWEQAFDGLSMRLQKFMA